MSQRAMNQQAVNHTVTDGAYGVLTEPATLTISRRLPGSIDRVWAYLTQSDLRRQWLASGEMTLEVGAPFEFHWRNDELTDPPGERPPGFSCEHKMESRITELDPPHRLSFTWRNSGDVTFELVEDDDEVVLTVTHRRLPDRGMLLGVSAGWHAHLDLFAMRLRGETPPPFWDGVVRLRAAYDGRIPA